MGVTLPKDAYGRVNVTITSNDQVGLFVRAISSPESTNAIVHIHDDVSLDHREVVGIGDFDGDSSDVLWRDENGRLKLWYWGVSANVDVTGATKAPLCRSSEASMAEPVSEGADRAALRRRWADLIRRVYEVDSLVCLRCGGEMRVVGFITQPAVIKRILDHLGKREKASRAPPLDPQPLASLA